MTRIQSNFWKKGAVSTVKVQRSFRNNTKRSKLNGMIVDTLGLQTDLRKAVMIPDGECRQEWFICNIIDFFNSIVILNGSLSDYCTPQSCPVMSAGDKFKYLWPGRGDGQKTLLNLDAPTYIDHLLTWVQKKLDDQSVFPPERVAVYPDAFDDTVHNIVRRLFRVYAHIYHSHFKSVEQLDEHKHLNTCFKHFMYFIECFELVDKKELAPLVYVIKKLIPDFSYGHGNSEITEGGRMDHSDSFDVNKDSTSRSSNCNRRSGGNSDGISSNDMAVKVPSKKTMFEDNRESMVISESKLQNDELIGFLCKSVNNLTTEIRDLKVDMDALRNQVATLHSLHNENTYIK